MERWNMPAHFYRHWGYVQTVRPIGGVEVQLYPFMTTTLEGGEGSASRPGRSLPPGKTQYQLYRRLGGPQGRSGQVRKISPPPGFDPRTVQPVASRYTDWATRSTSLPGLLLNLVTGVSLYLNILGYPYLYGSLILRVLLSIILCLLCTSCHNCPFDLSRTEKRDTHCFSNYISALSPIDVS